MPLLDHFQGPFGRTWPGFHNAWMATLAGLITDHLPPTFVAYSSGHFGIEIDVAALERLIDAGRDEGWRPTWTPPPADAEVSFTSATDELEVRLVEMDGGQLRLVAAVEFVSPANKDRPETRDAFVSKCHGYLTDGIGLMIVDVVTDRHANLHNELMDRIGQLDLAFDGHLYATSYRPTGENGSGRLAVWRHPLTVGGRLPTLPLWMLGGVCAPADLADSYRRACELVRIERAIEFFGPRPVSQPG